MSDSVNLKLRSLNRQMEYLEILQGRHLLWAGETEDPEAKRMHLEIADRCRTMMNQYQNLFDFYSPAEVFWIESVNRLATRSATQRVR